MIFTNAFRIAGLQSVTWFQLLPVEIASGNVPRNSEDTATKMLLAAHIQLQNEGHLSSWTFSSADKIRKVKLWLFVPGRQERSSIDGAFRVVKHGLWQCPGNSTEITAALCQALHNRLERALNTFFYARFGTVFVKCKRAVATDSDFRKTLPSCEIAFTASEEGVFVHIKVCKRRMRPISSSDIRAVLTQNPNSSSAVEKPAVVVAPYGLTGWLTGCLAADLVRQITQSKTDTFNGVPSRNYSNNWYVEVRMKFSLDRNTPSQKASTKNEKWIDKMFIFPSEAVLVPTLPPVSSRTYLKRCWLRKLAGTYWLEDALSLRGFSPLTSLHGHRLQAMGKSNTIWKLFSNSCKSSTSSGSGSSIKSSDSRGSSGTESDVNDGEYREDADSAATRAGHDTVDTDSRRAVNSLKRGREPRNSSYKNSKKGSPGALSAANNTDAALPGTKGGSQVGTPWIWNEDAFMQDDLFADFGDIGDFFEGDGFGFGDPPGTAESQAFMLPPELEGTGTPGTNYMDMSDPFLLPILDFPMLDGLQPEEVPEKEPDLGTVDDTKAEVKPATPAPTVPVDVSPVAKSEAALIFASDYAPVHLPTVGADVYSRVTDSTYKPEAATSTTMSTSAQFVYSATPRTPTKLERITEVKVLSKTGRKDASPAAAPVDARENGTTTIQQHHGNPKTPGSPIATVATDLECAMFQVQLQNLKGVAYCASTIDPNCDNPLKKLGNVPERIAGYADEVLHDGPRPVEVCVWRPVEPKQPKPEAPSTISASGEAGSPSENGDMQELLELIPLLVQQAASSSDISLMGERGDGALEWLTLQQKLNQQSASTSYDVCDPSLAEVSPATVVSILQSDMRQAIWTAFGEFFVAGPLNLPEWCRGKTGFMEPGSDSKDLLSSITGEPITPPQSTGISKGISLQDMDAHSSDFRRSREAERMSIDSLDMDSQTPSYGMLPVPTLLVGYQEDWLRTSPSSIKYWEKAPFEPYGYAKPVTYYVLCAGLDSLLQSASDFFHQLSSVYEACKLGTHTPANVSTQTSKKRPLFGFVSVDIACKLKSHITTSSTVNDYVTSLESGWTISEFGKSLRKACKSIAIAGPPATEGDDEHSPSTVVYVVSPTSEPPVILRTLLEACQGLRPGLKAKKLLGNTSFEENKPYTQPVTGFSIGRFALQIVTAETIFRLSTSQASGLDVLKELSFSVYNKLRRIPQKPSNTELQQPLASKARLGMNSQSSALSGLWKDCNRNAGMSVLGLERWEKSWQPPRLMDDTVGSYHAVPPSPSSRFLYEPLFILADSCLLEQAMGQLLHKEKPAEVMPGKGAGHGLGMTDTLLTAMESDKTCQRSCFHCCYTWSTNWQWIIAVWTDARGEMLDVNVLPVSRSGSEAGSKDLLQIFAQVLQQGLQLLSSGVMKPCNIVVTKLGELYEAEYHEWQRIFLSDELRTWSVQLRPDNVESAQRTLPGSPGPSSFTSRGMMLPGYSKVDHTIGKSNLHLDGFQLVQSFTLATVSHDSSLQLLSIDPAVSSASGLAAAFGMAKTVATLNGAYLLVPAHGLRFLPQQDTTTCKTDVPSMAQLLQSRGQVSPVASGYAISGPTKPSRSELPHISTEEEWPSTLHIGLVAYFGNSTRHGRQEMGIRLGGNGLCDLKLSSKDRMAEARFVLEQLASDMYALSWLNLSPMYLHRRRPLPFHCDIALRLDKLLCYATDELTSTQ